MEIIPFAYYEDDDCNEIYKFTFTSDTRKSNKFEDSQRVKIKIDGLNDDLVVEQSCTCDGWKYKKSCKHIKESWKILNKYGVNFRYDIPKKGK